MCPFTRGIPYTKLQWELLSGMQSLMWQRTGQALLFPDPHTPWWARPQWDLANKPPVSWTDPHLGSIYRKLVDYTLSVSFCTATHTDTAKFNILEGWLISWVCCELRWGDTKHLGFSASLPCAQSPLEVRICVTCPRSPGKWVAVAGTKPDLPKCPRLLTCLSTALCSKGDLLTRDGKEICSHLFIYTNIIQNIFSMCITWNSNALPHRSILLCREGMVLSEYGAFIPWTYFLQDVRLCNPAKLWAWLPLEKADSFSVFFFLRSTIPHEHLFSLCVGGLIAR